MFDEFLRDKGKNPENCKIRKGKKAPESKKFFLKLREGTVFTGNFDSIICMEFDPISISCTVVFLFVKQN